MNSWQLLFSVLSKSKISLWLSILFAFFTIFCNTALLTTSAWLIARAGEHPELVALSLAIVGVRFFGISRAVSRYIERYVSHYMAFQGLYGLRVWFYSHLEPLAPAILQKVGSGSLVNSIITDIETLQFFYLKVLIPPLAAILMTLVTGIFLSTFGGIFVAVLLVAAVLGGIVIPWLVVTLEKNATQEVLELQEQIKATTVETIDGMMDILTYQRADIQRGILEEKFQKLEKVQGRIEGNNNLGNTLFLLLIQITMLIGACAAMPLVSSSALSGVYIATISLGLQSYFEALQPMLVTFHHYQESSAAANRLLALAQENPKVIDPPMKLRNSLDIFEEGCTLSFDKMNFAYQDKPIYQDFTLALQPGEKIAIVGPSGSGKTTLLLLLARFYEYMGSITLNGKELKTIPQDEVRHVISYLSQESYIFHASLEANIRLAKPEATEEELQDALSFAMLTDFVKDLPQGVKTMLGSGEVKLSGGQQQRLALARLYLRNCPILLLDEPLEGLDQINRKQLQEALYKLMENKTVIYITHQLEGLEKMDHIVFLEEGKIKEYGSFQELMSQQGSFYKYRKLSMEKIQ